MKLITDDNIDAIILEADWLSLPQILNFSEDQTSEFLLKIVEFCTGVQLRPRTSDALVRLALSACIDDASGSHEALMSYLKLPEAPEGQNLKVMHGAE